MFMWHADEPVEAAALQFLNVLFAVPQLSVKLTQFPESHQEMVAFWTRYWKENRDLLMKGTFVPSSPGSVYPTITSYLDDKAIGAAYSESVIRLPDRDFSEIDLVNAKATSTVLLETIRPLGAVTLTTFDTRGSEVSKDSGRFGAGVHRFDVPPSGLVTIRRR